MGSARAQLIFELADTEIDVDDILASVANYLNGGKVDFAGINRAALTHLPSLLKTWLPDGTRRGHEWLARNPRRADRRPGSFSVNLTNGKWADFATGDAGGDVVSLAAYLFNTSQVDAARTLAAALGVDRQARP
jgi:hypothetical protein